MTQPSRQTSKIVTLAVTLFFLAAGFFLARIPWASASALHATPLLCGKLVFIDVKDSSVQQLGLVPCGETKPFIFDVRPRELFNYYRFHNVEIVSGSRMETVRYGALTKYIIGWDGYTQINACGECSAPPTETLQPTSTQQPSPTPSLEPSPTSTATLAPTTTQAPPPSPTMLAPTETPASIRPIITLPFSEDELPKILLMLVGGLVVVAVVIIGGGALIFFRLRKKR